LRREVPWVRRPPSEYIRRHVKLTAQPVDAPLRPSGALADLLAQMWNDELLMFSTDYPHWHAEEPLADLLTHLPADQRGRMLGGNACAHFGLDPSR
jgi:predicted TIM-barrel fold metal-dependent hydrolase